MTAPDRLPQADSHDRRAKSAPVVSLSRGSGASSSVESTSVGLRLRQGVTRALWVIGWPVRMMLLGVIRIYQRLISPLLAPSCRLYPCCSEYGVRAIHRHGAAKGSLLTAGRLVRCNPWNKGGIDQVPRRGQWRSPVNPDGTAREVEADPEDEAATRPR